MKSFILITMFSIFTFVNNIYAKDLILSKSQEQIKQVAHDVGAKNCIDGFCFNKILQAIAWQESSYCNNIIGDSEGVMYYYKHNSEVVNINETDIFVKDGVKYTYYQPYENKYIKKVYSRNGWKPLVESSLGPFQIKVTTAMEVITKMELKKYYPLLSNEKLLVSKLLSDEKFGALVAVSFLKMHYIRAKNDGVHNPLLRAISRYNGGNYNTVYINHIMKKVNLL